MKPTSEIKFKTYFDTSFEVQILSQVREGPRICILLCCVIDLDIKDTVNPFFLDTMITVKEDWEYYSEKVFQNLYEFIYEKTNLSSLPIQVNKEKFFIGKNEDGTYHLKPYLK